MNKTKVTHKDDGTTPLPTPSFEQGSWREWLPWDEENAHQARLALANLGLYPASPLEEDPHLATLEANHRASLHQIADHINRTDLFALFNLARLLTLIPRDPYLFTYIKQRTEAILIMHGLGHLAA